MKLWDGVLEEIKKKSIERINMGNLFEKFEEILLSQCMTGL